MCSGGVTSVAEGLQKVQNPKQKEIKKTDAVCICMRHTRICTCALTYMVSSGAKVQMNAAI